MTEPAAPHRLLLVEDDPGVRNTLRMLLELEGYRVETAENGRVGLERLRADDLPFLILLDLAMPVMDGAQFRREQLADPQLAHIPVVVCSAIAPDGIAAKQLKAVAYLTKPFHIDALLSVIRAVVEPPGLPAQA
jgi:CheY-like chemotaxis protein